MTIKQSGSVDWSINLLFTLLSRTPAASRNVMEVACCRCDNQRKAVNEILDSITSLKSNKKSPRRVSFSTDVVLLQAITDGSVEEIKSIACNHGKTALNLTDPTGLPLVMHALQEDKIDCFQLMVEQGADLSVTDEEGWTVLHLAASLANMDAVELIIKHKPELVETRASNGLRPISVSTNCQLTSFLLQAELKLLKVKNNACKKGKRKSCGNLVALNKAEELKLLQLVMAAPGKDDSNKVQEEMTLLRQNILHLAAARNYLGVAFYLLENNLTNVDAQDGEYWSAMHYAAMHSSIDVLMLLVKYGASRDLKTDSEQLPTDLTTQQNVLALLKKV